MSSSSLASSEEIEMETERVYRHDNDTSDDNIDATATTATSATSAASASAAALPSPASISNTSKSSISYSVSKSSTSRHNNTSLAVAVDSLLLDSNTKVAVSNSTVSKNSHKKKKKKSGNNKHAEKQINITKKKKMKRTKRIIKKKNHDITHHHKKHTSKNMTATMTTSTNAKAIIRNKTNTLLLLSSKPQKPKRVKLIYPVQLYHDGNDMTTANSNNTDDESSFFTTSLFCCSSESHENENVDSNSSSNRVLIVMPKSKTSVTPPPHEAIICSRIMREELSLNSCTTTTTLNNNLEKFKTFMTPQKIEQHDCWKKNNDLLRLQDTTNNNIKTTSSIITSYLHIPPNQQHHRRHFQLHHDHSHHNPNNNKQSSSPFLQYKKLIVQIHDLKFTNHPLFNDDDYALHAFLTIFTKYNTIKKDLCEKCQSLNDEIILLEKKKKEEVEMNNNIIIKSLRTIEIQHEELQDLESQILKKWSQIESLSSQNNNLQRIDFKINQVSIPYKNNYNDDDDGDDIEKDHYLYFIRDWIARYFDNYTNNSRKELVLDEDKDDEIVAPPTATFSGKKKKKKSKAKKKHRKNKKSQLQQQELFSSSSQETNKNNEKIQLYEILSRILNGYASSKGDSPHPIILQYNKYQLLTQEEATTRHNIHNDNVVEKEQQQQQQIIQSEKYYIRLLINNQYIDKHSGNHNLYNLEWPSFSVSFSSSKERFDCRILNPLKSICVELWQKKVEEEQKKQNINESSMLPMQWYTTRIRSKTDILLASNYISIPNNTDQHNNNNEEKNNTNHHHHHTKDWYQFSTCTNDTMKKKQGSILVSVKLTTTTTTCNKANLNNKFHNSDTAAIGAIRVSEVLPTVAVVSPLDNDSKYIYYHENTHCGMLENDLNTGFDSSIQQQQGQTKKENDNDDDDDEGYSKFRTIMILNSQSSSRHHHIIDRRTRKESLLRYRLLRLRCFSQNNESKIIRIPIHHDDIQSSCELDPSLIQLWNQCHFDRDDDDDDQLKKLCDENNAIKNSPTFFIQKNPFFYQSHQVDFVKRIQQNMRSMWITNNIYIIRNKKKLSKHNNNKRRSDKAMCDEASLLPIMSFDSQYEYYLPYRCNENSNSNSNQSSLLLPPQVNNMTIPQDMTIIREVDYGQKLKDRLFTPQPPPPPRNNNNNKGISFFSTRSNNKRDNRDLQHFDTKEKSNKPKETFQRLKITIVNAINLPHRKPSDSTTSTSSSSSLFFETDFLRDAHTKLKSFVQIKLSQRKINVKTRKVSGHSPFWKQTFDLDLNTNTTTSSSSKTDNTSSTYTTTTSSSTIHEEILNNMIFISLYDSVQVNLSSSSFDDDDSSNTGASVNTTPTQVTENCFLGDLQIPFHTLLKHKKIEGMFRLNTPEICFGYKTRKRMTMENDIVEIINNNMEHTVVQPSMSDTGTYIKLIMTLEGDNKKDDREEENDQQLQKDTGAFILQLGLSAQQKSTIAMWPRISSFSYFQNYSYFIFKNHFLRKKKNSSSFGENEEFLIYTQKWKDRFFQYYCNNNYLRHTHPSFRRFDNVWSILSRNILVSLFPHHEEEEGSSRDCGVFISRLLCAQEPPIMTFHNSFPQYEREDNLDTLDTEDTHKNNHQHQDNNCYSIENCIHYVRLIPYCKLMLYHKNNNYYQRLSSFNHQRKEMWFTNQQTINHVHSGDFKEHAVLLAGYLIWLNNNNNEKNIHKNESNKNSQIYLAFGHSPVEDHQVIIYILQQFPNTQTSILWNPITGIPYSHTDEHLPLTKIFFLVSTHNIYVNVQKYDVPSLMDFSNIRADHKSWFPFFFFGKNHQEDMNHYLSSSEEKTKTTIQSKIVYEKPNYQFAYELQQDLMDQIHIKIRQWRRKPTSIRVDITSRLNSILDTLEQSKYSSNNSSTSNTNTRSGKNKAKHEHNLDKLLLGLGVTHSKIYGIPIHFHGYTDIPSILHKIQRVGIHKKGSSQNDPKSVEFAVGVKVYAYPSNVYSIWVFLCSILP